MMLKLYVNSSKTYVFFNVFFPSIELRCVTLLPGKPLKNATNTNKVLEVSRTIILCHPVDLKPEAQSRVVLKVNRYSKLYESLDTKKEI